jgi:hypothetical protein
VAKRERSPILLRSYFPAPQLTQLVSYRGRCSFEHLEPSRRVRWPTASKPCHFGPNSSEDLVPNTVRSGIIAVSTSDCARILKNQTSGIGDFVEVPGRPWLVEGTEDKGGGPSALRLSCISDDAQGEALEVAWDVEIGARRLEDDVWSQVGPNGATTRQPSRTTPHPEMEHSNCGRSRPISGANPRRNPA